MARELDIRLIDTICIVSYQHQKQGELKVLKGVEGDGDGWLVVEDVIDTGVTMRPMPKNLLILLLPRCLCLTLSLDSN